MFRYNRIICRLTNEENSEGPERITRQHLDCEHEIGNKIQEETNKDWIWNNHLGNRSNKQVTLKKGRANLLQAVSPHFWTRVAASLMVTDRGVPRRGEVRRRMEATARPDHVDSVAAEGFLGPSSASGGELIDRPKGNRSA
jgi:hypothetical protein